MQVAFYAPMKPPDHPVASGDRSMARALVAALEQSGATVTLASRLQTRDGAGCAARQWALTDAARAEAERLIAAGRAAGWSVWMTYHNYYKAPDLIGPSVSRALGIPYVLVEATRARKRLTGNWAAFAHAAEAACDAADAILFLTERDAETLRRDAPVGQHLVHLRPFLPRRDLPACAAGGGGILCVGMMRDGDKLASYALVAETFKALATPEWQATLVGDGAARGTIARKMAPFGNAVRFCGALELGALEAAYDRADLLLWPGVNEAFGMVYLEAQARGIPVVAQDRPGVRDVLAPGTAAPPTEAGAAALAHAVDRWLTDPAARRGAGESARRHVQAHHLCNSASKVLIETLEKVAG